MRSGTMCIYLQPTEHEEGAKIHASFAAARGCDKLLSLVDRSTCST